MGVGKHNETEGMYGLKWRDARFEVLPPEDSLSEFQLELLSARAIGKRRVVKTKDTGSLMYLVNKSGYCQQECRCVGRG